LATDDLGVTQTWVAAAAAPPPARRSQLRAGVLVPAVLAVLLVVAVGFGLFELTRADDERPAPPAATGATTTSRVMPLPPPPEPPTTTLASPPAAAVIGADCVPAGSTSTTADGATAYCSTLQGTSATIWSLTQGEVPSPTVTIDPTETPLPVEQETPLRVCMQQTGQTRLRCRLDILRSNGQQ
jgi:serine/threonine-protein kinase